jgi:hypothetical protein
MNTPSNVDVRPQSRTGRYLRLFVLWFLDCCAATAWFVPYESTFWRDWRTDVRLHHLDVELRQLVADSAQEMGPSPAG